MITKFSMVVFLYLSCVVVQPSFSQSKKGVDGWYFITDSLIKATAKKPIVTVADFETLRIDSFPGQDKTMLYVITGTLKADKALVFADATEKAVGKQIGFLYKGEIICAPIVNSRIDGGNFQISSHATIKDRKKVYAVFEHLKKEMDFFNVKSRISK